MTCKPFGDVMQQNIIRLYDESQAVFKLQHVLNFYLKNELMCYKPTGIFDEHTESRVRKFQTQAGLVVDGVAGPITIKALRIDMTPELLSDDDYAAAAVELGVTAAHIRAVAEVETRARPFWEWQSNCTPILYERHIFDRNITKVAQAGKSSADLLMLRDKLRKIEPDICNPIAGGYGKESQQYPKLERAVTYSETVALGACSWGTFQIMGYHAELMGYHSVQAFVRSQQASQIDHLKAFVRYIKANPNLLSALRKKDWLSFARGYNGPAQNGYDKRMAEAFAKWNR